MRTALTFILLISMNMVFAQKEFRQQIRMKSYLVDMAFSPNGQVALSNLFQRYIINSADGECIYMEDYKLPYANHSKSCWIGNDTIMICSQFAEKTKLVGNTTDGNRRGFIKCDKTDFPAFTCFFSDKHNNHWFASGRTLYYMHGNSSQPDSIILFPEEDKNKKITGIYFEDEGKNGVVCINEKSLYCTKDQGHTLRRITTPLEQKKYLRRLTTANKLKRPIFFNKYLLISQDDHVFAADTTDLNWHLLEDMAWVDVANNDNLYGITNDQRLLVLDSALKLKKEISLPDVRILNLAVFKNDLYLLTRNALLRCNENFVRRIPLVAPTQILDFEDYPKYSVENESKINEEEDEDEVDDEKKEIFKWYNQYTVGKDIYYLSPNEIITQDSAGRWYRYMTIPEDNTSSFMENNTIYFYTRYGSLYAIDVKGKQVNPYEWSPQMKSDDKVTELKFIYESTGCFHHNLYSVKYTLDGDIYKRGKIEAHKWYKKRTNITKMPKYLKEEDVLALKDYINYIQHHEDEIDPIEISDEDKEECMRTLITENEEPLKYHIFIPQNDSNYVREQVRNISSINQKQLEATFSDNRIFTSTTTDKYGIVLTFNNGSRLICSSTNSDNYCWALWKIEQRKFYRIFPGIKLGLLISQLSENAFLPKENNTNAFALYQILRDKLFSNPYKYHDKFSIVE